MNRREQRRRAREALDTRMGNWPSAAAFSPPRSGWIRAIRDALGLSTRELGRRMSVSGASVSEMESNERSEGIRLSTLRRAAEAMDCTLVYALVPRDSLEGIVRRRAEEVLQSLLQTTDQTMLLEEQQADWSDASRERRLEEIIDSPRLWLDAWGER